ncbi:Hpt domain-containing protein [Roseovarius tibetensis]|uniref:Hpt domain-containing protein n=1 Tax=Roseovarius tibetensis TaxID=2685897 RepID=UPI003D7FB738
MTDVQDADRYKEACAVFGDEGAQARVRMLRSDLSKQLTRIAQGRFDHAALREMAHRTAGRAGTLGFADLADASARLDDAARHNDGVAAALEHWTQQARRAAEPPTPAMDGSS